jgi:ribose/xylose/arabinose/galactoside ABC-type transport system permease subunit
VDKTVAVKYLPVLKHNRVITLVMINITIVVLMCVIKSATFFTVSNFSGIFTSLAFDMLLSVGMTLVLILGGVDLSVGAVVAMSSIISATIARTYPVPVAIAGGLVTGALIGFINGFLISKAKLAPFIATLGMQTFVRGICYAKTAGYLISGLPPSFLNISRSKLFGVPVLVVISLSIMFVTGFLLSRLKIFRQMYLIGTSLKAAYISGIPADRVKITGYMICGTLAGLTGVLMASRYGMGNAQYGGGFEMRAIAAAVIGGAVMAGGEGNIFGTALGVFIVAVVNNAFIMFNGSPEWQYAISGIMLVIALYIDTLRNKNAIRKGLL